MPLQIFNQLTDTGTNQLTTKQMQQTHKREQFKIQKYKEKQEKRREKNNKQTQLTNKKENKLASLEATPVQNYDRLTDSLTH